jgi:hypothetical protein
MHPSLATRAMGYSPVHLSDERMQIRFITGNDLGQSAFLADRLLIQPVPALPVVVR